MLLRWTERSAYCRVRYSQDSKRVVFSSDYAQGYGSTFRRLSVDDPSHAEAFPAALRNLEQ